MNKNCDLAEDVLTEPWQDSYNSLQPEQTLNEGMFTVPWQDSYNPLQP